VEQALLVSGGMMVHLIKVNKILMGIVKINRKVLQDNKLISSKQPTNSLTTILIIIQLNRDIRVGTPPNNSKDHNNNNMQKIHINNKAVGEQTKEAAQHKKLLLEFQTNLVVIKVLIFLAGRIIVIIPKNLNMFVSKTTKLNNVKNNNPNTR
jgi:hypothetical protein